MNFLPLLALGAVDTDRLFKAACTAESDNNPKAQNGSCRGIVQIKPDLAHEMGYKTKQCFNVAVSQDIYKRRLKSAKSWYHAICIWRYGPNSETAKETATLSVADFKAHKHSKTLERFRQSKYWRTMEAIYGE